MVANEINLNISPEIAGVMEERGILAEDIAAVVAEAETANVKLYCEENRHVLAKKRLVKFTVYVEYSIDAADVEVHNVYSHRVSLNEDQN